MLELSRGYVAYLLAGYGEPEVAAAIVDAPDNRFQRVRDAANQAADEGSEWLIIACRVAVEVVEGKYRELKRGQLIAQDMPQEFLSEDRQAAALRAMTYVGGAPVKKREIFDGLAAAIAPELTGYTYFKSRGQFQKPFADGMSYVTLHRGRGIAYLSFGVTHDLILRAEQFLFGLRAPVASHRMPQSLVVMSMNINPRSHYWPHRIDASWLIFGEQGIPVASSEAATFIREVVVPFVDYNRSPERIRKTLLSTRGRIASMRAEQTVFAIDQMEQRRDWLEADLVAFKNRYQRYSRGDREKLQSDYATVMKRWEQKT